MRQRVQLRRGQLHVVDPVVFLVEVRRATGRRLTDAGRSSAGRVRGDGFASQQYRKRVLVNRQDLRRESEGRREFPGGRGNAGRPVLELEDSLRSPRARIDGSLLAFPPTVVGRVGRRQIEVYMIAIVGKLIIDL